MYKVEGIVPSLVVDAGSHTVKAGVAGEDLPHALIPSCLAQEYEPTEDISNKRYKPPHAGSFAVTQRRDNVDITNPFNDDGIVSDWNLFEHLLSHTLRKELQAETREHALLFAEPNHNSRDARERTVELIFEKFEVPALYLARSAVLSAYANGKTTGIVLDVGHSGTSAVPVEDGTVVKRNLIRTAVGGRKLNDMLNAELSRKEVRLRPVWSYKRRIVGSDGIDEDLMRRQSEVTDLSFPNTSASFIQFSRMRLIEEIKASICIVHENPTVDLSTLPAVSDAYELPDGNRLEMGMERFEIAEKTIFGLTPHIVAEKGSDTPLSYVNQYLNGANQKADEPKASNGLAGLVFDVINMCHSSLHRDMYAGVCLTGGTSDMGGLFERLSYGLLEGYQKVRVLAATGSSERKYCAWTGGSILATFPEFQKSWFSRSEYDENGSSFVHRKCQ